MRHRDRDLDDRRLRTARGAAAQGLRRRLLADASRSSACYWLGDALRRSTMSRTSSRPPASIARTFAGAFLFGMAMFGTLFLGVVLAIFLTLGTVRGDAERALLQPLVVRARSAASTLLVARFLGAAAVCVPYVLILYFAAMLLTGLEGSWWPDRIVTPGLELAGGVLIVAALSLSARSS